MQKLPVFTIMCLNTRRLLEKINTEHGLNINARYAIWIFSTSFFRDGISCFLNQNF